MLKKYRNVFHFIPRCQILCVERDKQTNKRREDLLSKKTSDVHACDEISSISPKNVTSHFKYYSTNI